MWKRDDAAWREALWRHMLEMLPVEVFVNLPAAAFSMRGRGDTSIYADDMRIEQYGQMISEWARMLGADKLQRRLSVDALERSFAGGAREVRFKLSTNIGALVASVQLQGNPLEELFIVRLQRSER